MQVEVGFWVLSIDAINVVDMVRMSAFCGFSRRSGNDAILSSCSLF